jgi:hypothetical protein
METLGVFGSLFYCPSQAKTVSSGFRQSLEELMQTAGCPQVSWMSGQMLWHRESQRMEDFRFCCF